MVAFQKVASFVQNEDGATAIEYGLIAALIAVGILLAMTAMGGSVNSMFGYIQNRAGNELDNINEI